MDPKYHVCWPRLTAKRVEPVVSISWASCWTTYTNFHTCWDRYIVTSRNLLYRCTSAFLALNNCCGIFFKSISYLYEVLRTTFLPIFGLLRNFWPWFRENCWKHRRNRPINGNALLVWTMHPSNTHTHSAPDSDHDKNKTKKTKKTNTIFSLLQPACVVRSSPSFAR